MGKIKGTQLIPSIWEGSFANYMKPSVEFSSGQLTDYGYFSFTSDSFPSKTDVDPDFIDGEHSFWF